MEDSLIDRTMGIRISAEKYPRFSNIFWVSFFTGLTGIVSLTASHGLHNFYYMQTTTNSTHQAHANTSCTERTVGLWAKCARPCNNQSAYQCSGLSLHHSEDFITVSRVFESVALAFAIFGVALSITSRRFRRMGELKTSILASGASGLLCIVGAYLFVLEFRNHTPEESTVKINPTVQFLDQGPRLSFYLCVLSFFMSMLTALLNGTDWCRVVNYGLD